MGETWFWLDFCFALLPARADPGFSSAKKSSPTTTESDDGGRHARIRAGAMHPNQCIHSIHSSPSTPISQAPSVGPRAAERGRCLYFEALDRSRRLLHHVGTCVRCAVRDSPHPPFGTTNQCPPPPHTHTYHDTTTYSTGQQLRGRVALPGLSGGDGRGVDGGLALGRRCVGCRGVDVCGMTIDRLVRGR